ncbi:MAG TPA: hypothetical protein DFS52_04895 [Myxococcales bacterium]|nr:hypothetical protein [Myxococcales bacterium]
MSAALVLIGCKGELCEGDCPDIAGLYQIQVVSVTGACGFSSLTLGPSLDLAQSADGRRVFAEVIDPTNDLRLLVAANVSNLEEGEGGSFSGFSQFASTARAKSDTPPQPLQVLLTGTVVESDGRLQLSGFLSTRQLQPEFCSVDLVFTGLGPFVTPAAE